jgi:hypothetical protein
VAVPLAFSDIVTPVPLSTVNVTVPVGVPEALVTLTTTDAGCVNVADAGGVMVVVVLMVGTAGAGIVNVNGVVALVEEICWFCEQMMA